ncbi:MAG: inorganic diphosphatase [Spirochaetales bacterium]|nr:inorganic diphosphatase [Spirochaetales bacterium]
MMTVFIEAEAGSFKKRRYDEETLKLLGYSMTRKRYPYPYGFIPGTRTDDGDAVDSYVITKTPLKAGQAYECEPAGLLEMIEGDETDHKVLSVPAGETAAMDETLKRELEEFILEIFKRYPDAHVRIGRLLPKEAALRHIEENRVG